MMNDKELREIRERCESATAGPWKSIVEGRDGTSFDSFITRGTKNNREEDLYLTGATIADHDFIAHAKQDIPILLAEIERLQSVILENIVMNGSEYEATKAAQQLGERKAVSAVPTLIGALHSKNAIASWDRLDTYTKVALGEIGEGIDAVQDLRCAAALALAQIGDVQAIPELQKILDSDHEYDLEIDDIIEKALAAFG